MTTDSKQTTAEDFEALTDNHVWELLNDPHVQRIILAGRIACDLPHGSVKQRRALVALDQLLHELRSTGPVSKPRAWGVIMDACARRDERLEEVTP